MPAAIVGVVGSVVAGGMQASASKSAANAQANAANQATLEQGRQYDLYREDTAPWRNRGGQAINQLGMRLGLGDGAPTATDRTALRNQLLPQFTSTQTPEMAGWQVMRSPNADGAGGYWQGPNGEMVPFEEGMTNMLLAGGRVGGNQVIDEAGLNAEIEKQLAARPDPTQNPLFGSLTRDVTKADIEGDPVYSMGFDFGMKQGQQALDRAAVAGGRFGSGRFIKDATKFASDYATTKAGEAWNRNWASRNNKFNMLSGVAGTGQTATQQIGQAGMQFGQMAGNNALAAGDARASGYVGRGNALTNAIGGIYGAGQKGGWWGGGDVQPTPYAPYQYGDSYNPDN